MEGLALLVLGAVLVDDLVLAKVAGPPRGPGAWRRGDGIGGVMSATAVVLVLSSALAWIIGQRFLLPAGLGSLRSFAFLVAVAAVVGTAGAALHRRDPPRYRAAGVRIPLVAGNVVVLGTALDGLPHASLSGTLLGACAIALAFAVALTLFTAMRERLDTADVPAAWRGAPIALVTAALMSLAAMGLAGMVPTR